MHKALTEKYYRSSPQCFPITETMNLRYSRVCPRKPPAFGGAALIIQRYTKNSFLHIQCRFACFLCRAFSVIAKMSSSILSTMAPPARLHVLVVTFPAFGHLIPLLELAKKITKYHDVTLALSESKIPELTKRELIAPNDLIELYGIPDGVTNDFDDPSDIGAFQRIFQDVLPAVRKLLAEIPTRQEMENSGNTRNSRISGVSGISRPVDIVIADNSVSSEAAVCHQRGIRYYIFNSANATMTQFILTLHPDTPTVSELDADLFMRIPKPGGPPVLLSENVLRLFIPMRTTIPMAAGLIINSFRDIELDALREIEKSPDMSGLTVHCVGPLLPVEKPTTESAELAMEKKVSQWLDRQGAKTVVYVSFGSMTTPTPEQITVIGQAFLALGQPFIWAIREKYQAALPDRIKMRITCQFDELDSKFLIVNWAPQKLILGHSSVNVFLSHCGWNSTLESLSHGKPIVAWPMFADQLLNGEWVAKLGAGVIIPNTGIKAPRLVPAEEIEQFITKVSEFAFRTAAQSWSERIATAWAPGGTSSVEFLDLVQFHARN